MKSLPIEKSKNGCYYQLLKRSEKVAIYEQRYAHFGMIIGYEVFIIRIRQAAEFHGIQFEASESFPGDEAFGSTAWTFSTETIAEKKYQELISQKGE